MPPSSPVAARFSAVACSACRATPSSAATTRSGCGSSRSCRRRCRVVEVADAEGLAARGRGGRDRRDLRRRRRRPQPRNRAAGKATQSARAGGRAAGQQRAARGVALATGRARSSTSPTWPRRRSSRHVWPAPPTRSRRRASSSSISGTDAPRDATLREMYGDLAPVAVVHGENSDDPGEVVACPGRDLRVHEGDWTAMIGTADELAAQGIAVPKPTAPRTRRADPPLRARDRRCPRLPRRRQPDVLPGARRVADPAARLDAAAAVHLPQPPGMSWIDALYFSTETIATVGYGDFSFVDQPTWLRLFGIVLMFAGVTTTAILWRSSPTCCCRDGWRNRRPTQGPRICATTSSSSASARSASGWSPISRPPGTTWWSSSAARTTATCRRRPNWMCR